MLAQVNLAQSKFKLHFLTIKYFFVVNQSISFSARCFVLSTENLNPPHLLTFSLSAGAQSLHFTLHSLARFGRFNSNFRALSLYERDLYFGNLRCKSTQDTIANIFRYEQFLLLQFRVQPQYLNPLKIIAGMNADPRMLITRI